MEIQLWREFLDPYALAVDELILKFNHLMTAYRKQDDYCPIEQVQGRVKSIASIIEKANRKKIPLETIEDDMWDICGIRLICQFVEDCYQVVDMIKSRTDMEVVSENDYIAFPKDSGYRSYHLRILYPVQSVGGAKKVHGEIQVRTLGMNSWSTIEHSLQYKYRSNIPDELKMRLRNAADGMIATDKELSSIRDEIRSARELRFEEERIVNDILLTIQNLYRFVSHREAVRIQEDFYNIYKEQNLEKLRHFATELDIIAEGYRAQTVN